MRRMQRTPDRVAKDDLHSHAWRQLKRQFRAAAAADPASKATFTALQTWVKNGRTGPLPPRPDKTALLATYKALQAKFVTTTAAINGGTITTTNQIDDALT